MNQEKAPLPSIPPLLTVSEERSFAYYTFTHRIPAILERVIEENKFSPAIEAKLKQLFFELKEGIISPIENDGGADIPAWEQYVQPYLGKRWIDTPFYFAETYFFRRLLQITEYFSSPISERIDPFKSQKNSSLETAIKSVCLIAKQLNQNLKNDYNQQSLINLLYLDLWGNRADLSLNPTGAGQFKHQETNPEVNHILLNDTSKIADKLTKIKGDRIDFIVDNAGFELISDLFLIDFLLSSGIAQKIYIHLKPYPIFVSDATEKDVLWTEDFLTNYPDESVNNFAHRLQQYQQNNRLYLVDDFFWASPLFFWEMPEQIEKKLAQSELVFIKGDANYRRLVGDCHWNKTSSFSDIVSYFPTDLVTLRTLKSEVIVGLSHEQIESVKASDANWLTNGNWGIIQLFEAKKR